MRRAFPCTAGRGRKKVARNSSVVRNHGRPNARRMSAEQERSLTNQGYGRSSATVKEPEMSRHLKPVRRDSRCSARDPGPAAWLPAFCLQRRMNECHDRAGSRSSSRQESIRAMVSLGWGGLRDPARGKTSALRSLRAACERPSPVKGTSLRTAILQGRGRRDLSLPIRLSAAAHPPSTFPGRLGPRVQTGVNRPSPAERPNNVRGKENVSGNCNFDTRQSRSAGCQPRKEALCRCGHGGCSFGTGVERDGCRCEEGISAANSSRVPQVKRPTSEGGSHGLRD
jgi:hypothetical protein